MRHWIKLYTEIVHDPKMGRLTDRQFRTCMNLFALAGEIDADGALPPANDMAWQLRMTPEDMAADLQALAAVNIIAIVDDTWVVVKWAERQSSAVSDTKDARRERVKEYRDRRSALGLPRGTAYQSDDLLERDGYACVYCGSTDNLCIDHALPTLLGGTDDDDNLVTACKRCNGGKAGRTPEQARYRFVNQEAERRYRSYLSSHPVTVTGAKAVIPVTTLDKNRVDENRTETEGDTETEGTRGDAPAAPPQPPAPHAHKAPEILPTPVQTFLEHGGKFPSGKLTDGTPKKARAIAYICEHVGSDSESLLLWGRVVAGYCAQWSAYSYTIMVQDYYLRNKVPGDHPPGRNNGNSPNGYEHPALQALRMVREEQVQHGNE